VGAMTLQPRRSIEYAGAALVLGALYLASTYSYLLFHSIVELFSIVIAAGIFMLAWNSRRFQTADYLLLLGIAYLYVGGVDLLHTLAYEGMGIFVGYGSNLATQLWVLARFTEAVALLAAPLFLRRKVDARWTLAGGAAVTGVALLTIFRGWFPACYVAGVGLTLFKRVSEYAIALVLMGALWLLHRYRDRLDRHVYSLLGLSIVLTIGAEISFTLYLSVYGLANLVGHLLKLASFYLIYKAIIRTGLVEPYNVLFRDLKEKEEVLQHAHSQLEQRVEERTAELTAANVQLSREVRERQRAEASLRESEARLRVLAQRLVTTQEEERRRLSRELHDEAGQALTALKINLDLAAEQAATETADVRDRILDASRLTDRTMERLRLLAHDLRPPALDAVGLNDTLEQLCREFSERTGSSVAYRGTEEIALSDEATISLYRFLQEALTNVAKHAEATTVDVSLHSGEEEVTLVVRDDGTGFDVRSASLARTGRGGQGLVGLKERIELLGGRFDIQSHIGGGTRIEARVPMREST
jgi:signal transduction histidine kinase